MSLPAQAQNSQDQCIIDPTKCETGGTSIPVPSSTVTDCIIDPTKCETGGTTGTPSSSPSTGSSGGSSGSGIFGWVTNIVPGLLGIFQHPVGALNTFIDNIIDFIASIWPSTPQGMTVGALIDSVSSALPNVGKGVIADFFSKITVAIGAAIVIKIYKLIPFKAS